MGSPPFFLGSRYMGLKTELLERLELIYLSSEVDLIGCRFVFDIDGNTEVVAFLQPSCNIFNIFIH